MTYGVDVYRRSMDSRGVGPVDPENNFFKGNARTVELRGHKRQCQGVAWSGDGRKLASTSYDTSVRIWHLESGSFNFKRNQDLVGHKDASLQVAWDPTHHDKVASIGADGYVRVWDTRSSKCIQDLNVGNGCINLAYRPDGTHLAVGDNKDVISFIDTRKFRTVETRQWKMEANELMWNRAGDIFFVVNGYGSVDVFAYPSLAQVDTVTGHTGSIFAIAGDRAGRYMAIGGEDGLVSIWDLSEMICLRTITEHEHNIKSIDFSPDGKYVASGAETFVLVSELETAKPLYKLPGTQSLAWHPSENLIAYAEYHDSDRATTVAVFGFPGQPTPSESRPEPREPRPEPRFDYRMENNYPHRNHYMGYGRSYY